MAERAACRHALLAAAGLVSGVVGWGRDGHTITAHVADSLLSSQAREALDRDIGGAGALTDVSVWCDGYDHTAAGRWSSQLHYINYPTHECRFDWQRDCGGDQCNAGALVNFSRQVYQPGLSADRRLMALRFVIHMMGDIHQPMHVGSKLDHGGNLIKIHENFSAAVDGHHRANNLHAVWDDSIVIRAIQEVPSGKPSNDWHDLSAYLLKALSTDWKDEVQGWRDAVAGARDEQLLRSGLTEVAQETAHIGCSKAYVDEHNSTIKQGKTLGEGYYEWGKPEVLRQLAKGGVRLAQLLNDLLEGGSSAGDAERVPPAPEPIALYEPKLIVV